MSLSVVHGISHPSQVHNAPTKKRNGKKEKRSMSIGAEIVG
jgi:hypothetical protein